MIQNHIKELQLTENDSLECSYVLSTILVHGEAVGMIIILNSEEKLSENEMQIASIVSSFMTKYLEQ